MNIKLKELIDELSIQRNDIALDRKTELNNLAFTIVDHLAENDGLEIIVVCTHNSRRSQLGEAWINTLVNHFDLNGIVAFSGGMEVTAFNHRMVNALLENGFGLQEVEEGENPKHSLADDGIENHQMFSKVYDHPMNPQADFMALMVCGHADENCPIVHGMKYRIPLRYKDPKEFDDTELEKKAYSDKVMEIGREIYYLLDMVNSQL